MLVTCLQLPHNIFYKEAATKLLPWNLGLRPRSRGNMSKQRVTAERMNIRSTCCFNTLLVWTPLNKFSAHQHGLHGVGQRGYLLLYRPIGLSALYRPQYRHRKSLISLQFDVICCIFIYGCRRRNFSTKSDKLGFSVVSLDR